MPLYDYYCKCCSKTHEIEHGINDPPAEVCPLCLVYGLKRQISSGTSIALKGDGWAKDGYSKTGGK